MSTDNELFDFGFTLVDEGELEAVQKAQAEWSEDGGGWACA